MKRTTKRIRSVAESAAKEDAPPDPPDSSVEEMGTGDGSDFTWPRAPVADARDEKGRWLKGYIPPGAKPAHSPPLITPERRERLLELLSQGYSITAAAREIGVRHDSLRFAIARNEELWADVQQAIRAGRLVSAVRVGRIASSIEERMEEEVRTAPAHALRSLATAAAIMRDKERDMAEVGAGASAQVNILAVQTDRESIAQLARAVLAAMETSEQHE